jgi:hypothetical protein
MSYAQRSKKKFFVEFFLRDYVVKMLIFSHPTVLNAIGQVSALSCVMYDDYL